MHDMTNRLRMPRTLGSVLAAAAVVAAFWTTCPPAAAQGRFLFDANSQRQAADFPSGLDWLNTSGPISLRDLRGKIVVIDFWTYCCINCMHIMPDLERLEKKYPNQVVVIGIHSAKFNEEKDTENIRRAILRYGLKHPVVNDSNHAIWNAYGATFWPEVGIIDPEGHLVGDVTGEDNMAKLDDAVEQLIKIHRAKKTLDERPLYFDLDKYKMRKTSPLLFPGKVLADPAGKRLFIADSSHNRVVVTDLDGKKLDVAGTGEEGKRDGSFDEATFNDPQGLALRGQTLYVADRKNDLIRALDLKARTVKTVAGNGERATVRGESGAGTSVALNSPWDLCLLGDILYIAMAGNHQIWWFNTRTGHVAPYVGVGKLAEDIKDGTAAVAMFAQPSGLATDNRSLYVADAESSAVRAVTLGSRPSVRTLIGTQSTQPGDGLFKFGDEDGGPSTARLQHCLGVAYHRGQVFVADTYNNKIKVIDPVRRTCRTYLGTGRPGLEDRPAQFNEPGGLCVAGDALYVADTNNHAIRVVDLRSRTVQTLKVTGLEPPAPPKVDPRQEYEGAQTTRLHEIALPKDGDVTLSVKLSLPEGYQLNPTAPARYLIVVVGSSDAQITGRVEQPKDPIEIKVPAAKFAGARRLQLSLTYYFCREGKGGVCRVKKQTWEFPVGIGGAGAKGVVELAATADRN